MSIATVGNTPTITLQTGTFTGGALGGGDFARFIEQQGNVTTTETTRTNAAGQTTTDQQVVTRNADGTITTTDNDIDVGGAPVLADNTLGVVQNGTRDLTGTVTLSNGATDQITGVEQATGDGTTQALTLTNAAGQTASEDISFTHGGTIDTSSVTGTGFNGASIDQQGTLTILSSMTFPAPSSAATPMSISGLGASPSGTVTGTFTGGVLGGGNFTRVFATSGDTETIDGGKTNASGQSVSDTIRITRNSDGTITRESSYTNLAGKTVTRDVTLGALNDGTRSITGTQTDANGGTEQIGGTLTPGAAGAYNAALTFTNANGQAATAALAYAQAGSVDTTSVTGTNYTGGAINWQEADTILSVTNNGTTV
jgi:hypothetical protein